MHTPIHDEVHSVWKQTREAAAAIARIEELTRVLKMIDGIKKPTQQMLALREDVDKRLASVVRNGQAR